MPGRRAGRDRTEQVDHLHRGSSRVHPALVATVGAVPCLLEGVGRQDPEDDRPTGLQADAQDPVGGGASDEVEVGRLALDDRAEADDPVGRLGAPEERERGDRQLERPRDAEHGDTVVIHPEDAELGDRRVDQPVDDVCVEASRRDRDADPAVAGCQGGHRRVPIRWPRRSAFVAR